MSKPLVQICFGSFGYEFGVARHATRVYNIPLYPSPSSELCQNYTGQDKRLRSSLMHLYDYENLVKTIQDDVQSELNNLLETEEFKEFKSPDDEEDSKEMKSRVPDFTLNFYIGCDHGRHRSVAVVEEVASMAVSHDSFDLEIEIEHRDLHRRQRLMARQAERQKRLKEKYNFRSLDESLDE
jgi:RNase adaptor protein for sRNA GlmZ degradation